MTATVDDVIAAYIKLRDKKEALEASVKEQTKELTEKMFKLENYLREQADAMGVTSFKTKHGTAFLTTTDFAAVADWDAVLDYVRVNGAYDLLERRVSKKAVRGYIDMTKQVPAGINYGTRLDINIRRPTTRLED